MPVNETPLNFDCGEDRLIGVLHRPEGPAARGVVVIVGGPQYRAGSHRQFVELGRGLAEGGHACLRFDYRGMGDSSGEMRDFRHIGEDVRAAVDALLSACPELHEVVLWGLCDGASAALMYAQQDARIAGVVAVNPWVRSAESLAEARVRHYYLQRLLQPEMWRKIASGRFEWRRSVWGAVEAVALIAGRMLRRRRPPPAAEPSFQQRMAHGWQGLRDSTLFVLSGRDITAQEFFDHACSDPAWQPFDGSEGPCLRRVPEADHTFAAAAWNQQLIAHTLAWLDAAPFASRSLP
ncbi:hydrolase 1, exosortase A system-associated [Azoarcus sp. TTM-91]|nr:hydrolase 1, exosortase A system-associated [Azoarcus sp. TTM-91]NMG33042.1 hydrolase 1, exosortase A system-associated [Azoarcus sp. TTM-91]